MVAWYTKVLVEWYTTVLVAWYTTVLVAWYTTALVACYTKETCRVLPLEENSSILVEILGLWATG